MKRKGNIYSWLFVLVFYTWMLVPFILEKVVGTPFDIKSLAADMKLARKPSLNPALLDPFPGEYETYFTEHFPYGENIRNYWLRKADSGWFNKPFSNREVAAGSEGWLFSRKVVPSADKNRALKASQIELIHQTIRNRVIFYRSEGIRFYVFFPPLKHRIYHEFLPLGYETEGDSTDADRLITILKRDTLVPFIDLRPVLAGAKSQGKLYEMSGSRWTSIGAYEAYSAVAGRLSRDFPSVKPLDRSRVDFIPYDTSGLEYAVSLGHGKEFTEEIYRSVIRDARSLEGRKAGYKAPPWSHVQDEFERVRLVPDSNLPRLVVIRDGYFDLMLPFISENFRKTVCIFDAYMYDLNWDIIRNEKPDAVILEVCEQNVKNIIHLY